MKYNNKTKKDYQCGKIKLSYKFKKIIYDIYMGNSKANLLVDNYGKCKDDAYEALKIK